MVLKRSTPRSDDRAPAHPHSEELRWQEAQTRAQEAAQALARRFEAEVRLPEPAHEPVREAAYRTWLSERSGMPLAALDSAPARAVELELIDPIEGLARLCVALRRDDGGPDIVLADPFDRGTRWWLETRLRAAGHPRSRWYVAPESDVTRYWRQVMRDVPLPLSATARSAGSAPCCETPPPAAPAAGGKASAEAHAGSGDQPALRQLREMVRKGLAGGARALRWTQPPREELSVDWRLATEWVYAGAGAQRRWAPEAAQCLWDALLRLSQARASTVPSVQRGTLRLPRAGRVYRCPVHFSLHADGTRLAVLTLPPEAHVEAAPPHPLTLEPDTAGLLRQALERPHGLVVLASPPECGKSTLLQACLSEAWALRPGAAVLRVLDDTPSSDPPPLGPLSTTDPSTLDDDETLSPTGRPTWTAHWPAHTDAAAAEATLDDLCTSLQPGLILIDEISHPALARWAVTQAASGRRVMATVSAPSGLWAHARLQTMLGGPSGALLDAVWLGALTQRLLPRVCPSCAGPARPSEAELQRSGLSRAQVAEEGWMLARCDGCEDCHGLGHTAEPVAVHHWWGGPGRPSSAHSLRHSALEQVRWGTVTLEEAHRAVALDE